MDLRPASRSSDVRLGESAAGGARGQLLVGPRLVELPLGALDLALWDIKGKVLKLPVHEILGGMVRN